MWIGDFVRDTTELRVVGVNFYIFNTDNSIPFQIRYLNQLKTLVLRVMKIVIVSRLSWKMM